MNKSYPRKAATGLAAVAAAFVSVLAFTSPASAGASITKPQSVTYYQYGNFYTGKCLAAGGRPTAP